MRDIHKYILAGLGIAVLLMFILIGMTMILRTGIIPHSSYKMAVITKIAISTTTATTQSTQTGEITSEGTAGDELALGAYVQIYGTGEVGLIIRSAPGIANEARFVAMENEVFIIEDGPVEKDNIVWWMLVSSYDQNRQGWAAGQYLQVMGTP
jgi:hypothetical protein